MKAGMHFGDFRSTSGSKCFVVVVAVVIMAGLAPAQANENESRRRVTKRYITGSGGYWMSEGICDPSWDSNHVGIVCLGDVDGGYVSLRIDDHSGQRVGGYAIITDGNGTTLYRQQFCQSSGPIALQPGVLFVYLDGPKNAYELGCPLEELGFATVGAVHATFTTSPPAQQETVRFGRIVSGVLTTGPAGTCREMPDCAAWLASGCDPALTGRNPAWLTSIENVADLADGSTRRLFEYGPARPGGLILGGMTVEFWRSDCTRIAEVDTWDEAASRAQRRAVLFVPRGAEWMTVAANDNVNAAWTLR